MCTDTIAQHEGPESEMETLTERVRLYVESTLLTEF